MSLNWYQVVPGHYRSGRYAIQRISLKEWKLEVWKDVDSTANTLATCKSKAQQIEDQRLAGHDPYFGSRPRKYRGRHAQYTDES